MNDSYLPPPPHPRAQLVLPEVDLRGREGPYLVDPGIRAAVNVALTMEMPLLLTGEPGCGKTDFAQVVANALDPVPAGELYPDPRKHGLLECHVRSERALATCSITMTHFCAWSHHKAERIGFSQRLCRDRRQGSEPDQ